MRARLILALLLLVPCTLMGQALYSEPSMSVCQAPMANGKPICTALNVQYRICALGTYSGLCSPTTTLYTDQTLGTVLGNPVSPDIQSNVSFWVAYPGWYVMQFVVNSSVVGSQIIQVSATGGSSGPATSLNLSIAPGLCTNGYATGIDVHGNAVCPSTSGDSDIVFTRQGVPSSGIPAGQSAVFVNSITGVLDCIDDDYSTHCMPAGGGLPSGPANEIVATPNGSSGAAALRAMVPADIPALPESQITGLVAALATIPPRRSTPANARHWRRRGADIFPLQQFHFTRLASNANRSPHRSPGLQEMERSHFYTPVLEKFRRWREFRQTRQISAV